MGESLGVELKWKVLLFGVMHIGIFFCFLLGSSYVDNTVYVFFSYRINELEKQLSILYQKQGRATQFSSKAARDKWLRKEIEDLKRVLDSNMVQVSLQY